MYDVVIVGSGLAAISCALNIENDKNVLLLTKNEISCNNSLLAQGGIAVTLSEDIQHIESHIQDTLKAGAFKNNKEVVSLLVEKSSSAVDFLENNGVVFDKENGGYALTKEGGHRQHRILHVGGDQSGKIIINSLIDRVLKKKNVTIFQDSFVYKIEEKSIGEYNVNYIKKDNAYQIRTQNLVIATGGIASLYKKSTNNINAIGSGMEFALSLGLELEGLAYMQFHPTTLYQKDNQTKQFLLTEALRGEGAKLYSEKNGYFMENRHELKDAAPRDIVSREILKEISNSSKEYVYLECKHIGSEEYLNSRFIQISKKLKEVGYDIFSTKIPIIPAAHYTVGGIKTDVHGQTKLKNLYACGEVASTGVHGANRLASNSLLECVVFGMEVASIINKKKSVATFEVILNSNEKIEFDFDDEDFPKLSTVLEMYCNIVRTRRGLELGMKEVNDVLKRSTNFLVKSRANLIKEIIQDCINQESLGCHYIEEENV